MSIWEKNTSTSSLCFLGNKCFRFVTWCFCFSRKGPLQTFARSLFQALGQWGRSKKRAGERRDQQRAGSGRKRERAGPLLFPYQIPLNRPRLHCHRAWNRLLCARSNIVTFSSLLKCIGGFHVTQVSLIITQVKNKIANHLINWVKKLKYRRGVVNKQRFKVSGMCDIPNSSYTAKGITENYSV